MGPTRSPPKSQLEHRVLEPKAHRDIPPVTYRWGSRDLGSGGFGGVTWVLGDVGVGAWVLGPEGPEGEEVGAAGAKILGFGKYRTQISNRKMISHAAICRYNKILYCIEVLQAYSQSYYR